MNNDIISRQAAIEAIDKYIHKFDCIDANFLDGLKTAKEILNDLPSAERLGRWEDVEHAPNGLLYATCSVCGKRQTVEAVNYCGNCGAQMLDGVEK